MPAFTNFAKKVNYCCPNIWKSKNLIEAIQKRRHEAMYTTDKKIRHIKHYIVNREEH
jgi:hypothetical protein